MDLRILFSVANFLNTLIQLFLLIIFFKLIHLFIFNEGTYLTQPWILFISVGVAMLYFINVGYMSIKRDNYIDTKLLNIDYLYIFSLFVILILVIWLIKSFSTVENILSDALSILALAITIATNFWAPKVTKLICKFIL